MKTTIYFIRHGQSKGNATRSFLGHTDWDLTELGYAQAERTALYFKDIKIDKIYSSDLIRAQNTAKPLSKLKGIEVILEPRIREIYAGDWETKCVEDIEKIYAEDYSLWLNDIGNSKATGGESVREVYKRAYEAIIDIVNQNLGKTVVIVAHGCVIRSLMASLRNMSVETMRDIKWAPNSSVSRFVYDGECFVMDIEGDNSHLGELKNSPMRAM